jgi:Ni/Fe-hydrogenase subunit HybB-like protein
VLLAWSAAAGNDPERRQARRFRLLSGPGLALYGVAATFASVDWVMSLEAGWYSTIFPLIFVSHHVLTGMAVALVATIALALHGRAEERLDSELLRDLGNLLLAFVMIWAYLAFSQYLLIWSENLPEEIPWYLRRLRGGWEWAALALVLFQFAAPFLLLLFREVKEDPRRLLTAAVAILALQFVSWLWLIEPSFESGPAWGGLLDVSAWAGLGGLWSWWFLGQLPRRMGGPAA